MKTEYRILPPRTHRDKQPFLTRVALSLKTSFSLDLLSGLKTALGAFFAPNVTIQYPLESAPLSPRYRAIHKLQRLLESENERCIGCGLCEKICTSNCIRIITDRGEDGRKKISSYSINFGRCIYCGLCAEVCPELAIVHGSRYENASTQRAHFGFKPELLESQSSCVEYDGFGSVSSNADERVIITPLSYTLDSIAKESSAPNESVKSQSTESQISHKENANV